MLINFSISVFVSYALWFFNCWSAGDAKLFSLLCFLLPLSFYENTNYLFFPSFNILINLFIPVIFFLSFLSTINMFKKNNFNIKSFINLLVGYLKASFIYIFLFLIIGKFFKFFLIENYVLFQTIYIVFMFITVRGMNKFFEKHFFLNYLLIFFTMGYSFYLVFSGEEELIQLVFFRVYIYLGSVFLIRSLINDYIDKCETEEVTREDIKEGMVVIFDNKTNRINEDNIEEMREKPGIKSYKVFPFSIFIFIAVMITILLKGSLLFFIF
ncbi:MAG: hypothetical protein PHF88_00045 [Candidatus Pacebacteria bacterium]|nr:hypothetical protein [Candidatus Paceibacterota bacterium]